jgi:HPt (histidine-containing phosphotransfer) domain-containing protein
VVSDLPPIDPAVVVSLRRLGERSGRNVFRELTTLFLSTADSQVRAAQSLLGQRDFAELARLAHGLKGSSSVMGGLRMSAAATALEATVGRTDGDGDVADCARAALARLTRELESFRSAVQKLDGKLLPGGPTG